MAKRKYPSLAVVGLSALFPGMTNDHYGAGPFWRDIFSGRDLISDVPPTRWRIDDYYDPDVTKRGKTYAKRGAFLNPIDFDPLIYGVPPKVLEQTDTSQLLALIVAQQVLKDAALGGVGGVNESNRDRMSVILGVTAGQELMNEMAASLERPVWQKALREAGFPEDAVQDACDRIEAHYTNWEESTFPGLLGNVVAGRIANRFNLGGTNCVTDAACASALSAIHLAANELYLGESDVVITGGVDTFNDIFMYMCFSKTPALSETGDCRPFSNDADGTILGEGLAMFALKRTDDAIRDNDPIYATIEGIGSSSDGRSKSIYAPVSAGQAKAITRAYQNAGYPLSSVGLIEAHGTGTKAGDVAEFGGLVEAFANDPDVEQQSIALGSIKGQIGHTKAAAGAAGLFKAIMAVSNRVLPGTIKVSAPNPKLNCENSPFYINSYSRPWISNQPRRAGVSSFGFGGSNFHITVQEPPTDHAAKRFHNWEEHLFIVTDTSVDGVKKQLEKLAKEVTSPQQLYTCATRSHLSYTHDAPYRLAFVASFDKIQDVISESLRVVEAHPKTSFSHPKGVYWGVGESATKMAWLFPGQGSQSVEMGKDLAMSFDVAGRTWDALALDLWEDKEEKNCVAHVVFPIPSFTEEEKREKETLLRATEWAQPGLGVASLAAYNLLRSIGLKPDACAGHSFGEVIALCAGGAMSQQCAIEIARCRGVLMRDAALEASQVGAMTAVRASAEQLTPYLVEGVVVANDNSPQQAVLSGALEAVERVEQRLTEENIRFVRLNVATAFHSDIVADSVKPFHNFLKTIDFSEPKLPVWSNVTAAPYAADTTIASQLSSAVAKPVRFKEMVQKMIDYGVNLFVEVGSQSVLTRLVQQIDPQVAAVSIDAPNQHGVTQFFRMLAVLVQKGVFFDLAKLDSNYKEEREEPTKGLQIPIAGGNYKKPYPPENSDEIPPPNDKNNLKYLPVDLIKNEQPQPSQRQETNNYVQKTINTNNISERVSTSMSDSHKIHGMNLNHQPQRVPNVDWFYALQEGQRQLAAAHSAYQDAMAQSHIAYLRAVESTQANLMNLISGGLLPPRPHDIPPSFEYRPTRHSFDTPSQPPLYPPPAPASPLHQAPQPQAVPSPVAPPSHYLHPTTPTPTHAQAYPPASGYAFAPPAPTPSPLPTQAHANPTPQVSHPPQAAHPVQPPQSSSPKGAWMSSSSGESRESSSNVATKPSSQHQTSQQPAATSAPKASLEDVLLETVADKTGYPAEMLEMGMKLEADLGIDSIKRVEILSAVTDAYPNLPEIDTGRMAELSTLGQILDYLSQDEKKKDDRRVVSEQVKVIESPSLNDTDSAPKETAPVEKDGENSVGKLAFGQSKSVTYESNFVAPPAPLPNDAEFFSESLVESTGDASAVARWVVRPYEVEEEGPPNETFALTKVHMVPDGFGFSDHVADELRSRGIGVEVVKSGNELPVDAEAVVYLKGAQVFYDLDDAVAINDDLFAAAKRVAHAMTERGGTFITLQNCGGRFGFDKKINSFQAASAGAPALLKTAKYEWPLANLKAIDIDLPENAAKHHDLAVRIADEICRPCDDSIEVGLVDDKRVMFELVQADPARDLEDAPSPLSLDHTDVVLASGGARGVTAFCLLELAKRTKSKFILLGRTPLEEETSRVAAAKTHPEIIKAIILDAKEEGRLIKPNECAQQAKRVRSSREIRQNLESFKRCGAEAVYLPVDVRDVQSVVDALATLPSHWGAVSLLVHGAGVLADKKISDKTFEQFDQVFSTKINGFYTLLASVDKEKLKGIVFFSSAAARSGNRGQSDYAMANEVLNKLAESIAKEHPNMLVKSMGWGPWRGGMVDESLELFFENKGVKLIELEDGAAAFADELLSNDREVEVCFGEVEFSGVEEESALTDYVPKREELSLDKLCSLNVAPWLEDHSVKGDPIYPMIGVMEWMMEVASGMYDNVVAWRFDEVAIRQGIRVPKGGEKPFVVLGKQVGERQGISCEVVDAKTNAQHYHASLRPVERVVSENRPLPRRREEWQKTIYDGEALFHQGVFQSLEAVYNVRDHSIFGELRDLDYAEDRIGPEGPRLVAIDAALQLVLLWIKANMNGIALPMSIEMATISNEPWPTRGLVISATIEHRGAKHAKASAEVQDANGRSFAVLKGIQSYIY